MRARESGRSPVGSRPRRWASGASVAVGLLLIVVLAGCDGASASPAGSPGSTLPSGPSSTPGPSLSAAPSDEPSTGPTVEPTETPTEEPTTEPTPTETAGEATSTPSTGGTGPCFGSPKTRAFLADFAQAVSWPVYCAILSKDWSLEKLEYRLANGGRLTGIFRRRADGARLVLDQGAVCAETNPCVPSGSDLGTTPFGDRDADLSTINGGFAAVVDATENPAWLLTGTGLSQKDFSAIAAKLRLLDL